MTQQQEDKTSKRPPRPFVGVGAALGIVFGLAIGAVLNNVAVGIGVGVALGAALGCGIRTHNRPQIINPISRVLPHAAAGRVWSRPGT
jgi:uncharacterized membrane protein